MAKAKKVVKVSEEASSLREAKLQVFLASIKSEMDEIIYTSEDNIPDVPRLTFGIPSLDDGFGGGIVRGKVCEILGVESSGKTTLCLTVIRRDQQTNPDSLSLIIDVEHALDRKYMFDADKLALDKTKVHIVQPDDLLHACTIFGRAAESGLYSVIVFDSTAGKVKEEDVETNYVGNDKGQASEARVLNQCLSKSVSDLNRNGTIALFCSQLRASMSMYGPKEVATGGNALKFYASTRVDLRRKEQIKVGTKEDATIIANLIRIKFIKNKTGVPHKEVELRIEFGTGFNGTYDILEWAIGRGIVEKSGSWHSYKGERIGNGEANVVEFLNDHPDLLATIYEELYANNSEA